MATDTYDTTSYELAPITTRFTALFIDAVILSAIGSVGFMAAREPGVGAGFLIALVYFWFFLTRNKGQTPGKLLMRIRVIKTDGSPISDRDALVRYIGSVVNSIVLIGWLWVLFDANKQGWHDKFANTYVVKSE